MDRLLYETLTKYYKTLSITGYKDYTVSYKMLVMLYIQEIFDTEFRHFVKHEDVKLMQDLLYQFIGSTCEITFPTNCKCCRTTIINNYPTPDIKTSITDFKLIPSNTSYTGDTSITFTSASFNITKSENFVEDSLEIIWEDEVVLSNLSTASSAVAFVEPITKELKAGNTYTAKASVKDADGTKYYSNSFIIEVKEAPVPVIPIYMYTGNTDDKPTLDNILGGTKYDYNNTKQFNTPAMTLKTIWVCLPKDVELLSMENANFQGDFMYNSTTGRDLMAHEDITIDGKEYTLHYLKSVIATLNPYITKVR